MKLFKFKRNMFKQLLRESHSCPSNTMMCSCDRAACRYTSLPSPCGQYSRLLCKGANIIGVHAVLRKTKNFPLQSLLTGESWVFDFAVIDVGGKCNNCNRILGRLICSARSNSADSRNDRVATRSILAPFCWSFKPTLSNLVFDIHCLGKWISIKHEYIQFPWDMTTSNK